jgi:hypothetical protein
MKTFSANALSELLERDRATIVRALGKVPPDATERKQPRWKLITALDALDRLPGSHNARTSTRRTITTDKDWRDPRIIEASDNFLKAFDEMLAIEDLEVRRAFARKKLGPIIAYNSRNTRLWMVENGHDEYFAELSTESTWHLSINYVRRFCEWTDDEAYDELVIPQDDWPEDELKEHLEKRKQQNKKLLARLKRLEREHAFDS